jgi:hypothetical protein
MIKKINRCIILSLICINITLEASHKKKEFTFSIINFDSISKESKFQQDNSLYILYPNRFGSISLAKSDFFTSDIADQLKKITNRHEKNAYRQKLIELGFMQENKITIYKRLESLKYKHKNGYKLF